MKLTKRYKICLNSSHPETIMKYFVTNLNNHKTQNRSGHLVYLCSRSKIKKEKWQTKYVNFYTPREEILAYPQYNRLWLDPFSTTFHDA